MAMRHIPSFPSVIRVPGPPKRARFIPGGSSVGAMILPPGQQRAGMPPNVTSVWAIQPGVGAMLTAPGIFATTR